MGKGFHLRREFEDRVRASQRRDFDAAAKQFKANQYQSASLSSLDANIAAKALSNAVGGDQQPKSQKRTAGTGVQVEPKIRFDPGATKKPGQVLKLYTTIDEMRSSGTEPNFGWVDDPSKNQTPIREVIAALAQRPEIVVSDVDKNVRTGEYQESKALGERLVSMVGDIGSRAARAAGFIVDELGKLRCPPGTPAANQFTNERGENCFSPKAVIQDVISRTSRRIERLQQNRVAARLLDSRMGELAVPSNGMPSRFARLRERLRETESQFPKGSSTFREDDLILDWWEQNMERLGELDPEDQMDIRMGIAARAAIRNNKQKAAEAQQRIDSKLQSLLSRFGITSPSANNQDIWELMEAWASSNDPRMAGFEWQDFFGTLFPKDDPQNGAFAYTYDPTKSMQENLVARREKLIEAFMFVADKYGDLRKKYDAGDSEAIKAVEDFLAFHGAWERGILKSIFDYQSDMPVNKPSTLKKIALYIPDRIFGEGAITTSEVLPNGELITAIYFNPMRMMEGWRSKEVTRALIKGKPFKITATGPQTDSQKTDEIRRALDSATNYFEYMLVMAELENMSFVAALTDSQEMVASQFTFHELTHVEQFEAVAKVAQDVYQRTGKFTYYRRIDEGKFQKIELTDPPDQWSNEEWIEITMGVMSGLVEDLPDDFPPFQLQELELAAAHFLATQYPLTYLDDAIRAGKGRSEAAQLEARFQYHMALQELMAEIKGYYKTGLIGGPAIEDLISRHDAYIGRPSARPAAVPFAPTVPIPAPKFAKKPVLPGQKPVNRPIRPPALIPSTAPPPNVPSTTPTSPSLPNVPSSPTAPSPRPTIPTAPQPSPAAIVPQPSVAPLIIDQEEQYQNAVQDALERGWLTHDRQAREAINEMFGFDDKPYDRLTPEELDTRFELLRDEAERLRKLGYGSTIITDRNSPDYKNQFRLYLCVKGMMQVANQNAARMRLSAEKKREARKYGREVDSGKYFQSTLTQRGLDLKAVNKLREDLERVHTGEDVGFFVADPDAGQPRAPLRMGSSTTATVPKQPKQQLPPSILTRRQALSAADGHFTTVNTRLNDRQRRASASDIAARLQAFSSPESLQSQVQSSATIQKMSRVRPGEVPTASSSDIAAMIDEELDFLIDGLEAIDLSVTSEPFMGSFEWSGMDGSNLEVGSEIDFNTPLRASLTSREQLGVSRQFPQDVGSSQVIVHMPRGSKALLAPGKDGGRSDSMFIPSGKFEIIDIDEDGIVHISPIHQDSKNEYLARVKNLVDGLEPAEGERGIKKRLKKVIAQRQDVATLDSRSSNLVGMRSSRRSVGVSADRVTAARSTARNIELATKRDQQNIRPLQTDERWIQQTFEDRDPAESIPTISAFGHKIMTPDARRLENRQTVLSRISQLRDNAETGNIFGLNRSEAADFDPAVLDFISSQDDETILNFVIDAATTYANGFDDRVRLSATPEQLNELLLEGTFPSPHKAGTAIGREQRKQLETVLGYPPRTSDDLRTTSGWVDHTRNQYERYEHLAAKNRLADDKALLFADEDFIDPAYDFQPAGNNIALAGEIEIVTRPEVAQRTSWAFGDPIRRDGGSYPAGLFSANGEDILQAMTPADDDKGIARLHELIRSGITGDWSGLQSSDHLLTPNRGGINRSDYLATVQGKEALGVEAVIHGPVSLDQVEYVKMPLRSLEGATDVNSVRLSSMKLNQGDVVRKALSSAGLEDWEIAWFMDNASSFDDANIKTLKSVINARSYAESTKNDFGIDVKFTNEDGMNILDANTHRELAKSVNVEDTAEDVLYSEMRRDIRRRPDQWAQQIKSGIKAAGLDSSDSHRFTMPSRRGMASRSTSVVTVDDASFDFAEFDYDLRDEVNKANAKWSMELFELLKDSPISRSLFWEMGEGEDRLVFLNTNVDTDDETLAERPIEEVLVETIRSSSLSDPDKQRALTLAQSLFAVNKFKDVEYQLSEKEVIGTAKEKDIWTGELVDKPVYGDFIVPQQEHGIRFAEAIDNLPDPTKRELIRMLGDRTQTDKTQKEIEKQKDSLYEQRREAQSRSSQLLKGGSMMPERPNPTRSDDTSMVTAKQKTSASEFAPESGVVRSPEDLDKQFSEVLVAHKDLLTSDRRDILDTATIFADDEVRKLIKKMIEQSENPFASSPTENDPDAQMQKELAHQLFERIARIRGFDRPAIKVTAEELDNAVAEGNFRELARGGSDWMGNELLNGELSPYGTGIQGYGLYFAQETHAVDPTKDGRDLAYPAATYARSANGSVARAGIHGSAKTYSLETLRKETDDFITYATIISSPVDSDGNYVIERPTYRELVTPQRVAELLEGMKNNPVFKFDAAISDLLSSGDLNAEERRQLQEFQEMFRTAIRLADRSQEVSGGATMAALLMGIDALFGSSVIDNKTVILNRTALIFADKLLSPDEWEATKGRENLLKRIGDRERKRGVPIPIDSTDEDMQNWLTGEIQKLQSKTLPEPIFKMPAFERALPQRYNKYEQSASLGRL